MTAFERFIPAGAGNTLTKTNLDIFFPVHPRRRGEHTESTRTRTDHIGSSPQARGTLWLFQYIQQLMRFIPAGAGNTLWHE
uniref:Uncharacterized protein n=1 Tax=mine drainage metagenome TaxID=410659 RepID=E6QU51_9ZZZZ